MSTVNSSCITAVFTESYCGSPLSCICFNAGGTKHNTRYSHSTEARTVLETDKSFFSVFLGKKKKKRGTLTNNLFTLDVYILFFCHLLFLILRLSLKKKSGLCGNFIIKGYILSAKFYAQATVN